MANWVRDFLERNPSAEVIKRARHSLHVKGPGQTRIAYITALPMHYEEAGEWFPIDTTLEEISPDIYSARGLGVRLRKNGFIEIADSNYSQITQDIGLFNAVTCKFSSVWKMPQGKIDDNCVIREGDGWKHELRLTESGLCETLTLFKAPVIQAKAGEWLVLETVIKGLAFPDGWLDEFSKSDYQFHLPTVIDADGNEAPCKRYWQKGKLYSGVLISWLATAKYPVTFDPNFAGDMADGYVQGRSNVSYATARSTATIYGSATPSFSVGQRWSSSYYSVYRDFLKFDTSTIGANSIVLQGNLQFVGFSDTSSTDFDVQIIKCNWAEQYPLSDANKEAAYDNCLNAILDSSIWRNTLDMVLNTPYISGNLDTTWIQKTASTYYGLRSSRDSLEITPIGLEYINLASADNLIVAYRPVLIVEYQLPLLIVADSIHTNIVESPVLTQVHNLIPADTILDCLVESLALTQVHNLIPVDTVLSCLVESLALTQVHALIIASALHIHLAEESTLERIFILKIEAANHIHTVESLALLRVSILAVANTYHACDIENLTFGLIYALLTHNRFYIRGIEERSIRSIQGYSIRLI